ncbi:MAG: hypothetical protein PHE56_03340 [Bacteroidales bacterium]|nr:hypothetical protein [Bacteroidales bacterium]
MIVERILQIIDSKGLNKRKFYLMTGLSNGFLDKVQDVGASKVEIILSVFPDINPVWLLSGKGPMLKNPELMSEDEIKQHDKEVEAGKWHHSSKMEKDFSETEHLNNIIGAMKHEIDELRNRLAEYAERLSEQKETINAQKDLITILKKSSPKTPQCATDKSRTQS